MCAVPTIKPAPEKWTHTRAVAQMISAWFIVFIGVYQLVLFRQPLVSVRYISTMILANGVASFLNHGWHGVFWSFLDSTTMFMPTR